ncbi:MAG: hypothetical protein ACYS9Y_08145, partial [Planctomycetota bacterium]
YGPTKGAENQGAKFLSALASIIDSEDTKEIEQISDSLIDPVGLVYMYSLPSSIKMKFDDVKFSRRVQ